MSAPEPWPPQKRQLVKAKIDKEARRAKERLGAHSVLLVAFFADGPYLHVQDGGTAPNGDFGGVYRHLLSVQEMLAASGGKDVKVQ